MGLFLFDFVGENRLLFIGLDSLILEMEENYTVLFINVVAVPTFVHFFVVVYICHLRLTGVGAG